MCCETEPMMEAATSTSTNCFLLADEDMKDDKEQNKLYVILDMDPSAFKGENALEARILLNVVDSTEILAQEMASPVATHAQESTEVNAISPSSLSSSNGDGHTSSAESSMISARWKQRLLQCEFEGCSRTFLWPANLKYHLLTHTGSRLFKCPFKGCDKRFYTKQRLDVHLRTPHGPEWTGDKPFTCPIDNCEKSFTTAGNLKNHVRTHTGERPFVCDVQGCSKRFAELSSLKKHALVHTGDKPFACEICGKLFSQVGSRNVHWRKHHQNRNSEGSSACYTTTVSDDTQVVLCHAVEEFVTTEVLEENAVPEAVITTTVDQMVTTDSSCGTVTVESPNETDVAGEEIMVATADMEEKTPDFSDSPPGLCASSETHANVIVVAQPQTISELAQYLG